MWHKHVPTVVSWKVCLPLKNPVLEVNSTKKFSKPTGGALDRGASYHATTIGIGWTWVRVEYDENVLSSRL
jgi:hypothetical protein